MRVLDDLYDNEFKASIKEWSVVNSNAIKSYEIPARPDSMVDMVGHINNLTTLKSSLNQIVVRPLSYDIRTRLMQFYVKADQQKLERINQIKTEAQEQRKKSIIDYEAKTNEVLEYNASLTKQMEMKHAELQQYKETLKPVFLRYGIKSSSMSISDDTTEKEFLGLLDASIEVCQKYDKQNKFGVAKFLELIKRDDPLISLALLGGTFIAIYFVLPIIGIIGYSFLFYTIFHLARDVDKLKLAKSLMAEVNYKRFVPKEAFREIDKMPDFDQYDRDANKKIEEVRAKSDSRQESLKEAEEYQNKINKECEQEAQILRDKINELSSRLDTELTECNDILEKYKSEHKLFPAEINSSECMSRKYVLGRLNGILDVPIAVPQRNVTFLCKQDNRDEIIKLCKLFLCNALLSVQVKRLDVTFFDPTYQAKEFAEFFSNETKDYIKVTNKDFEATLKEFRDYAQLNIQSLNHQTIDDFNEYAYKNDITTKPYHMLVIISGLKEPKDGNEDESFKNLKEFINHSRENGVLVWTLSNYRFPGTLVVDGTYLCNQGTPIEYTNEIGEETMSIYKKALYEYRDRGIDYRTKFGNKYIPEDKYWSWDTIHSIDLNFGLEDGDPAKGFPIQMGDKQVHAIMGGATGAGKSAAINQMIVSLITKYPPSELQIMYVDFKNVEAAKFTKGKNEDGTWYTTEKDLQVKRDQIYHVRYAYIPQFKIIAGTTDGEYALSLFEYLMQEMNRRQKILNKFGVTKVEKLREDLLEDYNKSHNTPNGTWADMRKDWDYYKPNILDQGLELPRFLIILDEFQVMFNPEFIDQRTIDSISAKITALAKLMRAMSCHFWFTSQSMKGTMSKDTMGQFSLRAALRCTTEVSEELLGNRAASTITAAFGYMYTNTSTGQTESANKFWRVPFLPEEELPSYINKVNSMLEERHEYSLDAQFYDEKTLPPCEVIDEWYKKYPDAFSDVNTFIIGERTAYSTNQAPVTIKLEPTSGENISISGFEEDDVCNNTLTIIRNLQHKENSVIVMNIQDRETYKILNPDRFVMEAFRDAAKPDQDIYEFVDTIRDLITNREETNQPLTKTIFIFLVKWEKADGIFSGRQDYREQDVIRNLMMRGPSVGVHFICVSREKLEMAKWFHGSCNHKLGALNTKDSFFFIDTMKVEKLPSKDQNVGNFAIYEYGSSHNKFKIYQHPLEKSASREVVL